MNLDVKKLFRTDMKEVIELYQQSLENLTKLSEEKIQLSEQISETETNIKVKVASDTTLKNATQRKAEEKRLLKKDVEYEAKKNRLNEIRYELAVAEADKKILKMIYEYHLKYDKN
ncbi:MAG: hypothetical protein ACQESN_08750 [Thermotogota bacterium]